MLQPRRTTPFLALLALLAAPAGAQWASTPLQPGAAPAAEGFLVTQAGSGGVQVFSAASRAWTTIAPPAAALVGTGDWTVLARDGNAWTAYSARRNDTAALVTSGTVLAALVDDDVALVVEGPLAGPPRAHGYSAVTNTWSPVALTQAPGTDDVAIARFVIGLRDAAAYHGFAARTGAWSTLPVAQPGAPPQAGGNVLLADLGAAGTGSGPRVVAGFSGVRGGWDLSPLYAPGTPLLASHNVAYLRADAAAPAFVGAAYSAYEGRWSLSSVVRVPATTLRETISDNVVLLEDPANALVRFEAFGSEPGVWAPLPGDWRRLVHAASYAVLADGSDSLLMAFSGQCAGAWTPRAIGGPPVVAGAGDHEGLVRAGGTLHGFSPARSAWAPAILVSAGAVITAADAVSDVLDGDFLGCATRGGGWVAGPAVPAASFDTFAAGSVIVHRQATGAESGDLFVFDERGGRWPAPFDPGGFPNLALGRNLVIASVPGAAAPVHGYSVQRGDWLAPEGFVPPVALGPFVEENVAWVVDDAGSVWAFGAPNEGHVQHAWPNGTEYHASGKGASGATPFVAYDVRANAGVLAGAFVALNALPVPVAIPGIDGTLCLDPSPLIPLGLLGTSDGQALLELVLALSGPLPPCVQLWFQPLVFDPGTLQLRWGDRCDPAWFF